MRTRIVGLMIFGMLWGAGNAGATLPRRVHFTAGPQPTSVTVHTSTDLYFVFVNGRRTNMQSSHRTWHGYDLRGGGLRMRVTLLRGGLEFCAVARKPHTRITLLLEPTPSA